MPEFVVRGEHTLTVRLSTALYQSTLNVYEVRENGTVESTIEAGSTGQLLIPVTTEDGGRIEGLAIRSVPIVYDEAGEPSILNGEWSVSFIYED